jgi:DNA oxidative demethylase
VFAHVVGIAPGSVYHPTGEARHEWEHPIATIAATRRSITFRSPSQKGRAQGMPA